MHDSQSNHCGKLLVNPVTWKKAKPIPFFARSRVGIVKALYHNIVLLALSLTLASPSAIAYKP